MKTFRLKILSIGALCVLSAKLLADDPIPAPVAVDTNREAYLQIQQQLHAAELALQTIESNRQEMAVAAQRNADALNARIQSLEQAVTDQRAAEIAAAQQSQQVTLLVATGGGLLVVAFVLVVIYLQWRSMTRLVELSASHQKLLASFNAQRELPSVITGATVENSNAKLLNAVDELEKRIRGLEQPASPASPPSASPELAAKISTALLEHKNGVNGSAKPVDDREECIANLLSEGQELLTANEPEKALECFEVALGLQADHPEALVKKGGALEKLGREDEAIACYDRAIAANSALTVAYLHKGGLFNRMARYDEALKCYEQALRTQEKNGGNPAAEKLLAVN